MRQSLRLLLVGMSCWCLLCGNSLVGAATSDVTGHWKNYAPCRFPGFAGTYPELGRWQGDGFTVESWCKPETHRTGYAVLKKHSFGFPCWNRNGKLMLYLSPDGYGQQIECDLPENEWTHLVWTGTRTQLCVFANGKLVFQRQQDSIPPYSEAPLLVGTSGGWQPDYRGEIGLIRIYERALKEDEIIRHCQELQRGGRLEESDAIWEIGGAGGRTVWQCGGKGSRQLEEFEVNDRRFEWSALLTRQADGASVPVALPGIGDLRLDARGGVSVSLTTTAGTFILPFRRPLAKGEPTDLKVSWNGRMVQLFVNGEPEGDAQALAGRLLKTGSRFVIGAGFRGTVERLSWKRQSSLPKTLGDRVVKPAMNDWQDKVRHQRSRHLRGQVERMKPLLDFEDLSGWTVAYTSGVTEGSLARSQEEPLWGKYVARIVLKKGPYRLRSCNEVVLRPPRPIFIADDFDAVNAWVFSQGFRKRPSLEVVFQVTDASGSQHDILLNHEGISWLHWRGWGIWHRPVGRMIQGPSRLTGIVFRNLNEAERTIFMDSVSFYRESRASLSDARVPSWKELGIPTSPDTILPSDGGPSPAIRFGGNLESGWHWDNGQVRFSYRPVTGTLSDVTVQHGKSRWLPMRHGGWRFASDEGRLSVTDSRVSARLLGHSVTSSGRVTVRWEYRVGREVMESTWRLDMKRNSLILDLSGDKGMVAECHVGHVEGADSPLVFEVPYMALKGWHHHSYPPGVLHAEGMFLSCLLDWYNSDSSELAGDSSGRGAGSFQWIQALADVVWVPGTSRQSDTSSLSVVNGGSVYFPKTDGRRNPPHERIFLTVAPTLEQVLPTIPHHPYSWNAENADRVWSTRMWYVKALPYSTYFDEELAFWRAMASYGVNRLNVRFHGNLNRMYTPRYNGDPMTFISEVIEPGIGGDKACRTLFDGMKALGMRPGLYTDHTLLSPLSYDAWDEDLLTRNRCGNWEYGCDSMMQVKNSRMIELQKKYNRIFREKFKPSCSYLDQLTCPPAWRYTDYDARAPEAGKFSAAYRVFVQSLRQEELDFGPVLSEGKMQWMFAGICDSYAQPQHEQMPLLPDFQLRKLHMLSNDCGYHLSLVSSCQERHRNRVYELLAYELAYGNTGHLFWNYHGAPPMKDLPLCLKSYFMIQGVQSYYANIPIKEILYPVGGVLVPVEAMLAKVRGSVNQVKLVYENGLEVCVNLRPDSVWNVTLQGKSYALPFAGFAAVLAGQVEAYSALRDGHRVDYLSNGKYLYADGRGRPTDFGRLQSQGACVLWKESDGLKILPIDLLKGQTLALSHASGRLIPLDMKRRPVGTESTYVAGQRLEVDGVPWGWLLRTSH